MQMRRDFLFHVCYDIRMDAHQTLLAWQAYEYEFREKSTDWFWALGIITIAGAVAAFLFHDVLFGIFILIAGATLAMYGVRKPQLQNYQITEGGILIDKYFFPYNNITSFYVTKDPYHNVLLIHTDRMMMPVITIPLIDVAPPEVEDILRRHLPEIPMDEPVFHKIMDRIGF